MSQAQKTNSKEMEQLKELKTLLSKKLGMKEVDFDLYVIDATNQILGRMASNIVKLMKGSMKTGKWPVIFIINSEKAVISGPRERVVKGYHLLFTVKTKWNPEKQGIRRPRNPARIVKRTIRGMLPKNYLGKLMYRSILAYVGNPVGLQKFVSEEAKSFSKEGVKTVSFKDADVSRLKGDYVTVLELAKLMGWNNG